MFISYEFRGSALSSLRGKNIQGVLVAAYKMNNHCNAYRDIYSNMFSVCISYCMLGEIIFASTLFFSVQSIHLVCSFNTTPSLDLHITSLLIPTLSTFLLRPN